METFRENGSDLGPLSAKIVVFPEMPAWFRFEEQAGFGVLESFSRGFEGFTAPNRTRQAPAGLAFLQAKMGQAVGHPTGTG